MKVETKIIIPAAGYGTRVGSPESKEMLIIENNQPLIDFSLQLASITNARSHVITRVEKKSLINYLTPQSNVDIQLISPSREWPDTILKSKAHWGDYNLLILPDTRFEPMTIVLDLIEGLKHFDVTVGCFNPSNLSTWGAFNLTHSTYQLIEKPRDINIENFKAWGILGFRKEIGEELFKLLLESTIDHQIKTTSFSFKAYDLNSFIDLTR